MKKKDLAAVPVYIAAIFLPLIMDFKFCPAEFTGYPWFPNQEVWLDVFLYGSARANVSVSVVQTAAVKADVKTLTLYNAAAGEAYGKLVTLKNAGTQKGKTVTYTVPVTLTLKK